MSRSDVTGSGETGPKVTALLVDGPLEGVKLAVEIIEGRPPRTVEVPDDRGTCRYCLAEWTQAGPSADYTYLYRV